MAYRCSDKQKATRQAWRDAHPGHNAVYQKAYSIANAEKKKTMAMEWYYAHLDKAKDNELKRKYGISLVEHQEMCAEADWRCEICGKHTENLHVDHDHLTGKVRGLLCASCNHGLGFFWDDQAILSLAIEYLDKNQNE